MNAPGSAQALASVQVNCPTHPSRYHHWRLSLSGAVAMLAAAFDKNAGLCPGDKLKLNSCDLGVDIELSGAVQRIRFECTEVVTRACAQRSAWTHKVGRSLAT